MRLKQWVEREGRGEIMRLMRVTGLSYQAVHAIAHGRKSSYDSAERISKATDGAVSIAELCEAVPAAAAPPPRVKRKRAPARRRKAARKRVTPARRRKVRA